MPLYGDYYGTYGGAYGGGGPYGSPYSSSPSPSWAFYKMLSSVLNYGLDMGRGGVISISNPSSNYYMDTRSWVSPVSPRYVTTWCGLPRPGPSRERPLPTAGPGPRPQAPLCVTAWRRPSRTGRAPLLRGRETDRVDSCCSTLCLCDNM